VETKFPEARISAIRNLDGALLLPREAFGISESDEKPPNQTRLPAIAGDDRSI
jgi:hypothetical protein